MLALIHVNTLRHQKLQRLLLLLLFPGDFNIIDESAGVIFADKFMPSYWVCSTNGGRIKFAFRLNVRSSTVRCSLHVTPYIVEFDGKLLF